MRRKEYLKKKFEYYQHMKKLRTKESFMLMERMRLEIILLEIRTRRELATELAENLMDGYEAKKEDDKNEDTE